jgi:hypothetical protein
LLANLLQDGSSTAVLDFLARHASYADYSQAARKNKRRANRPQSYIGTGRACREKKANDAKIGKMGKALVYVSRSLANGKHLPALKGRARNLTKQQHFYAEKMSSTKTRQPGAAGSASAVSPTP